MKTDLQLEFAKLLGFMGLGYFSFCVFNSFLLAIPFAMAGSAIVAISYKLSQKKT